MMFRIASVVALCALLSDASLFYDGAKPAYYTAWNEAAEVRKTKEPKSIKFPERPDGFDDDRVAQLTNRADRAWVPQNPPPAVTARHVVNQADWGAVATISTRKDIQSFPVANVVSIADGPVGNGTGIPYMYLTPLSFTAQDVAKDNRVTLLVSLTQGNYCKDNGYDPMDPRCVRVMLTGKIVALKNGTKEHEVAKQLFFDRHPQMRNMPSYHYFFFAKLKMSVIAMLDTFGGVKYVPINEYFNPPVVYRSPLLQRKSSRRIIIHQPRFP
ncbi:PREDICTED: protein CREG1-like [Vollenhovia emeryi]|uniref:protein CREG1-like n=1 Tax=Vollenhovia emeryi TaxID=411798 RepID=UPI0005F3FEC8|nr:PREDICTED: protein CREG1-like [Vollenhovia emeryi]